MTSKYIKNIRPALQSLKDNGLIVDFYQRDDLYWHVDNRRGNTATLSDEMAIGFIEGVFSQNLDLEVLLPLQSSLRTSPRGLKK